MTDLELALLDALIEIYAAFQVDYPSITARVTGQQVAALYEQYPAEIEAALARWTATHVLDELAAQAQQDGDYDG